MADLYEEGRGVWNEFLGEGVLPFQHIVLHLLEGELECNRISRPYLIQSEGRQYKNWYLLELEEVCDEIRSLGRAFVPDHRRRTSSAG